MKHKTNKKTKNTKPVLQDGDKNYRKKSDICGALPTVHPTGLCGPCCFGEADTAEGNW